MKSKMVELLAPAGDKESFILAINNGANAIYVAGKSFGARAYAPNFTTEELIEMIGYAHSQDVKVYVTVNTIIKNKELNECIDFVGKLYLAGVDAIIIQDLGLASILMKMYPSISLHASTQMNCHSVKYAFDLARLGFKRVILARETPLEVVKEINEKVDIEVEVFAHGALCMCYSGNCYLSSIIGKRSGNRGRCAQPCRLAYQLGKIDNSQEVINSSKKYYLSPRDLCTIDDLKQIVDAGVSSIKIEGRMKKSEYVGLITRYYRYALDGKVKADDLEKYKQDMAVMFNRTFTKGFILNETNKHITNISTSNHIGVVIGKVTKYANNYCHIKLDRPIRQGDGLRILSKDNDAIIVNNMFVNGIKGITANKNDLVQIKTHKVVEVGSIVLKTSDALLTDDILATPKKDISLSAELYLDDVATLKLSDGKNEVVVKTNYPYEKATSQSIKERQKEQLTKTGDAGYKITNIKIKDEIFLPIKEINDLRRRAIEAIDSLRKERKEVIINKFKPSDKEVFQSDEKKLLFKVRNLNQVIACVNGGANDILVDDEKLFEEASSYKKVFPDLNITLIDKRINDNGILNKKIVDVYNNIINYQSIRVMLEEGAEIVGLSIEASKDDIASSINTYKEIYGHIPNVMVMVYGYYELMIMKHCLINKSLGLDHMHCGACSKDNYFLVDRLGYKFPLINDGNCHLKLLNAKRTHLLNYIEELMKMGVNNYLVDLSIEDDYVEVIEEYIEAFNAILNGKRYTENVKFDNVTYGHYKEGVE